MLSDRVCHGGPPLAWICSARTSDTTPSDCVIEHLFDQELIRVSLNEALSLPLLDKDSILEALFDTLGCDGPEQRERLSRASDEILFRLASASATAILVNWWNQDTAPARLVETADSLIEVFCDCPLDIAAARFAQRERHPGHLDRTRTPEENEQGLHRLPATYRGPLRLGGPLVTIDTSQPVDAALLVGAVSAAIGE